jgi:hypothetical protein
MAIWIELGPENVAAFEQHSKIERDWRKEPEKSRESPIL